MSLNCSGERYVTLQIPSMLFNNDSGQEPLTRWLTDDFPPHLIPLGMEEEKISRGTRTVSLNRVGVLCLVFQKCSL